ncbi:TonB-dependent receptor, partial [Pseudoalteromonas sp. S1688]|uniref:TonB-dependent receptor domain-containing protein n=1 Tax=Pseudoalteromonas sp. S1688 TaxID=579511 RepID=UPI00110AA2C3
DLTDELTIGGGLRYSEDKKDANALFPRFSERKFISADFTALTWVINASYQLSNNMNLYGQVQKGYQTGGFPPRPFGGPAQFVSFDATKAGNDEIGVKGLVQENGARRLAMGGHGFADFA